MAATPESTPVAPPRQRRLGEHETGAAFFGYSENNVENPKSGLDSL
jgi:hypothetical protein